MRDKFVLIASHAGSVINFRRNLIGSLQDQFLEVHVVVPRNSGPANEKELKKIKELGVVPHEVYLNRAGINPILDLISLISITTLLCRVKPKYVLAYTIKPVIYGMLASKISGVKHCFALITGLGVVFNKNENLKQKVLLFVVKFLYKIGLSCAEKVFFQNPDDRELFINEKIVRISKACNVNGSGVDLEHYRFSDIPNKPISFLMMSRLLKSKGVRIYFEAAKNIKAIYPDVRFFLAGDVDNLNSDSISKSELNSWVEKEVINYYGHLEDVRSAVANCSVYVLPSFYREGVPRSILEALSIGRAIITTNTPGCKETVIDGENGYLITPKSESELSASMLKFIESPGVIGKMGLKSRKIAEEKYDVEKVNSFMLKTMKICP